MDDLLNKIESAPKNIMLLGSIGLMLFSILILIIGVAMDFLLAGLVVGLPVFFVGIILGEAIKAENEGEIESPA